LTDSGSHYWEGVMSRWVYLLGVGAALVAVALAVTDRALSLQPGVTEANARRVRPGMTLSDVEVLFGSRAYVTCLPFLNRARETPRLGEDLRTRRWWKGHGGSARVIFDDDDRVAETRFDRYSSTGCPLARLRAWLGW
jgi:hypothetical protein